MEKKHLSSFSSRTPEKTEKSHKQHATTSLNLENIQTAATRQGSPLPKEETIDKVRCSPLVEVYAQEIQRLSKTIYGNAFLFDRDIENILENPAAKDKILDQVKKYPTSIHPLAGGRVFGFKTKARKQAEKALHCLCPAINVYAEAVHQAYESMNITATVDSKTLERSLQKSLTTGKNGPYLSNEEITNLVRSNQNVREYYTQVKYWNRVVYDNPEALKMPMEDALQSPAIGEQLLWKMKADPASFHKLAGRSMLGFKDETRKSAESHLSRLHDAFESYVLTIKEVKEAILQEQEAKQGRINLSENKKQEVKQKLQKSQKRQHMPQHAMQADRSAGAAAQEAVSSPKLFLSNEEVVDMTRSEPSVQRYHDRVSYWSSVVYNNPNALQKSMEDILRNPYMGSRLLRDIVKSPASFHKLAGHSMLGFKDDARKSAEAHLSHLHDAFESYVLTVKETKGSILHEQETKQKLQQGQEKQHAPQHDVQQHRAKSGRGMAFAM
ncbi:BID domain-containing T4SS effector [Bartonella sp. B39]